MNRSVYPTILATVILLLMATAIALVPFFYWWDWISWHEAVPCEERVIEVEFTMRRAIGWWIIFGGVLVGFVVYVATRRP